MNVEGTLPGKRAKSVPLDLGDPIDDGSVYMMYCGGRIKIGHTTSLFRRKKHLENSGTLPVFIVFLMTGGSKTERWLHERFADDRLHGEWFRLSDDLRTFILENDDETAETALEDAEVQSRVL